MLQAHTLLWHYLWIAPNVILLLLAGWGWRRLKEQFPVFLIFAVLSATQQLTLYAADILPWVSGETFWRIDSISLLIDVLLKFVLIAELFSRLFGLYPSIAQTSRSFVRGAGATLVLVATVIAINSRSDSTYLAISRTHLLGQTGFIIECGLVLLLFLFAGYFRLSWDRASFGVALGLGISASVHLATWAAMANSNLSVHGRILLDFVNMATYHVCVLIWSYYLLVLSKKVSRPGGPPPPEHSLEVWNRELERLLHQ
jgi:hypothetical protein